MESKSDGWFHGQHPMWWAMRLLAAYKQFTSRTFNRSHVPLPLAVRRQMSACSPKRMG